MSNEQIESFLLAAEFGGGPELDLHGTNDLQNGIHELDVFLNQQFVAGERAVKIIHGRGTGAMRQAVQEHLASVQFVETFRDSQNVSEVLGVTVAVLSSRYPRV